MPVPTRTRYHVVALTVALGMVTYLDRVCISTLAKDIMRDLSLSETQMGYVFSAFIIDEGLHFDHEGFVCYATAGGGRACAGYRGIGGGSQGWLSFNRRRDRRGCRGKRGGRCHEVDGDG